MADNYSQIVRDNLNRLYDCLPADLARFLPAKQDRRRFIFDAFGERCVLSPEKITLGDKECPSVVGILITLYALHAVSDHSLLSPHKAFKQFSNSMPYVGAFSTHAEQVLVPHVAVIKQAMPVITATLNGREELSELGCDFAFIVYPLPKIALIYIFYEADDDFPAAVTCLFSNNADRFMPIDGLADVGEYTSAKILEMIA